MTKCTIRDAKPEDAARIAELQKAAGCKIDLDMTNATGFWLVAENGAGVVACVTARIGLPVSSIEQFAVDPKLPARKRAEVWLGFEETATAGLAAKGAQYLSAFVPFKEKAYRKALEKRGARSLDQGHIMVKRLR